MRRRKGFTLVELLVVITIIGILAGLLIPVIWSAVKRGRKAQAEAEVNILAQALANFNSKHGFYPPSRLVFHETGYLGTPPSGDRYFAQFEHADPYQNIGGTDTGPVAGSVEHRDLVQSSVKALRSWFPRLRVSTAAWTPGSPSLAPAGQWYDINANGDPGPDAEPILLDGHEVLYLALCGLGDWEGNRRDGFTLRGAAGLNSNPRNPFIGAGPLGPSEGSRVSPLFEVPGPERLSDDDRDGIPALLDPLGVSSDARYVAYFAPRDGQYDPRDVRLEPASLGTFFVPGEGLLQVPGPNPWATGPTDRMGQAPRWHRPQSYQLLSPGLDRVYGPGGEIERRSGSWEYPGDRGRFEEDNVGLR